MTPREFVLRAQRRLELTDGELARLCGCVRTSVVHWRSGRHEPNARAVLAIVDTLIERNASGLGLPPATAGT